MTTQGEFTEDEGIEELEGEPEAESPEARVFRVGGISYIHIPSKNGYESGNFYNAVFGWALTGEPAWPSFQDSTGHIIGRWVPDPQVASEGTGILPYVYVESVDEILDLAAANGGEVDRMPFREGEIWVATFRDPSGTCMGVWQSGPRRGA